MPGILPQKIIRVGVQTETRIACDRCRNKKIRCDGIQPSCSQCCNVGSLCTTSNKSSSSRFPQAYTELLEDRVGALEREVRDLKDLLDEKDEGIDILFRTTIGTPDNYRQYNEQSNGKLSGHFETEYISKSGGVRFNTFLFSNEESHGHQNTDTQPMCREDVQNWIQDSLESVTNPTATPAIRLLVTFIPNNATAQDRATFIRRLRHLQEQLCHSFKPVIEGLQLPEDLLMTFGRVMIDKIPLSSTRTEQEADPNLHFIYHIGFLFFSLTYRYFPKSKTSIGVVLVQDPEIFSQLSAGLAKHRELIGHPHILPFVAQWAIHSQLTTWLNVQKEAIIEGQAETGHHAMMALARSGRLVDYSQLSAKMTGIVINIEDVVFCWTILAEHGDMLMDGASLQARMEGDEKSTTGSSAAAAFQVEVHRFRRQTQICLLEAKSWERRGTILQQGIFNLIAQQDQNTSIGIAEDSRILAAESKRDSTSMKTLAVVTMAFLPGAFVAVSKPAT
ncbi:hypothetical protein F5Y01DRAFT_280326 [Xylaria sp. FL0043]|nr:hypothetical protein F5Y01DRAFT_280326 [Xylaria sp. FL0043]